MKLNYNKHKIISTSFLETLETFTNFRIKSSTQAKMTIKEQFQKVLAIILMICLIILLLFTIYNQYEIMEALVDPATTICGKVNYA